MQISPCKFCHKMPVIIDKQGIGDIECPNKCQNGKLYKILYDNKGLIIARFSLTHFSGKFHTSKKQAIANWNKAQE